MDRVPPPGLPPSRRVRLRRSVLAFALVVVALGTIVGVGATLHTAASYMQGMPNIDAIRPHGVLSNSRVYDGQGDELGMLASVENHQTVTANQIAPVMLEATVAIEDRRFFEHGGVDPRGIARAGWNDLHAGSAVEGGSTLSQQLVSQLYIKKDRTIGRKLREAHLAMQLEKRLTKEEILVLYVNTVFYGNGAYGIEAASQIYFSRPARDLTVAQAALLAGLPQSPTDYNPFEHPGRARARRDAVLAAMRDNGYITAAQYAALVARGLRLEPGNVYGKTAEPMFVRYVYNEALTQPDLERLGATNGLRIRTTLNRRLQRNARETMFGVLRSPGDPQAALVSIRPKTGEIVAMASTRSFRSSQFDLASQAARQPGSTFKTITLATAIAAGMDPDSTYYNSSPFTYQPDPTAEAWEVSTAGGDYLGYTSVSDALLASDNTVFAQLALDVGPKRIVKMARRLGIKRAELKPVPSITLGSSGVSPLEMTSAYATLAAGGVYRAPTAIRKITNLQGQPLILDRPKAERVIPDWVAAKVTEILGQNMDYGTGTNAKMSDGRPQAGKTGTTEDYTDAWFCGYTPDLATCVWIGYPRGLVPMYNIEGVEAVSGPTLPSDIWHAYMDRALDGYGPTEFPEATAEPDYVDIETAFGKDELYGSD